MSKEERVQYTVGTKAFSRRCGMTPDSDENSDIASTISTESDPDGFFDSE